MKLFLIHVGFYDPEIIKGLYEQHSNYFVVAEDIKEAQKKARQNPIYKRKKMHIDGIREIDSVEDYRVTLEKKNEEAVNIEGAKYSYDDVKRI